MAKAEARMKIYEQEKLEAKVQSEKLVVTEEFRKDKEVHMVWSIVDATKRSEEELYDPERQASKGQENR